MNPVASPSPSTASGVRPAAVSDAASCPSRRGILVLYVGGTIGMKKNKEGALEPCAGYLLKEVRNMHELRESREISPFTIVEYEKLLDSSEMNAADYLRVAGDIQKYYDQYDGFVVAHGTDTMHYTASALSFLLHNLAKPVIVTGAMVPLAEPFNDARRNLIVSMMIASHANVCEVCVFFNDRLFRGNRCDKVRHTYGAFETPNYAALGVMEATKFVLRERYLLPQPTGAMHVMSNLSGQVMVLPLPPDADVETIQRLLAARRAPVEDCRCTGVSSSQSSSESTPSRSTDRERPLLDGIILVLCGIGAVDGVVARQLRRIAEVAQRHDIVVAVTQPEVRGTLNPAEVARLHKAAPTLVYTGDMTTAAAEVKMMYLFGKGLSPSQVAAQMPLNLRGEVTPVLSPTAVESSL